MALVVAFIPDLLFGSNVLGGLQAAGQDAVLVSDEDGLRGALPGAGVLIVDLTADAGARIELANRVLAGGQTPGPAGGQTPALSDARVRTLAFYAHVEADVRAAAEDAGFDLVVPRSRMAREGPGLVNRLLTS